MINIELRSIDHENQRYETPGDYWEDSDSVITRDNPEGRMEHYRVSKMSDRRYEFLVLFHELIENELCKVDGIKEEDITAFDVCFESKRNQRLLKCERGSPEYEKILQEEPGDDPQAPYYRQHQTATGFERLLASLIGVDWNKYGDEVCHLGEKIEA